MLRLKFIKHQAVEIEYGLRDIPFESQKQLEIKYKGVTLRKKYSSDFLVFSKIILKIKFEAKLTNIDEARLHNYLKDTGFKVGLLINFGTTKIEIKRIVKQDPWNTPNGKDFNQPNS